MRVFSCLLEHGVDPYRSHHQDDGVGRPSFGPTRLTRQRRWPLERRSEIFPRRPRIPPHRINNLRFCFRASRLSDFRRKSFVFNDSPFQLETVNTVI